MGDAAAYARLQGMVTTEMQGTGMRTIEKGWRMQQRLMEKSGSLSSYFF